MTIAKILKWLSGTAGIALVIYMLAIVWTLNAYRFKVIDPADPRFKAEDFRFEDYFLDETISERNVRDTMFPPGTDRTYVERILVKKVGAKVWDLSYALKTDPVSGAIFWIEYKYDPWWNTAYKIFGLMNGVMFDGAHFRIDVFYDSNNKVVEVH